MNAPHRPLGPRPRPVHTGLPRPLWACCAVVVVTPTYQGRRCYCLVPRKYPPPAWPAAWPLPGAASTIDPERGCECGYADWLCDQRRAT